MRHSISIVLVLAGAVCCGTAGARQQEGTAGREELPPAQEFFPSQAQPSGQPKTTTKEPQKPTTQPSTEPTTPSLDSLSQAPTTGAESFSGFSPHMIGDQVGVFGLRTVVVPSFQTITTIQTQTQTMQSTVQVPTTVLVQQGQPIMIFIDGVFQTMPSPFTFRVTTNVPQTTTQTTTTQVPIITVNPTNVQTTVRVPIATHGAFKIGENESPRPEDRIFFTYNFYSDATGPLSGLNVPRFDTFVTTINGNPTTISTFIPGIAPRIDVHREVFGFEKTFFDGYASIGLRAPVIEEPGGAAFGLSDFGDLTIVSKLALWRDIPTGDVFSVGLVLTAPTGPSIDTIAGSIQSTLVQPFMGFVLSNGGFYVQGFSSVAVPTDSHDVILFFNDLSIGYQEFLGRADQLIRSVGPAFEVHVTTPLNHRDALAPIQVPDLVVLTEGVHIGIYNNSTLTLGLAEPVTGPRPFDIEAFVQFNLRF
jgi:hypothetical protein